MTSRIPQRAMSADVTTFAARWDAALGPVARRTLEDDFAAAHPTNPVLGARHGRDTGDELVETTFLWRLEDDRPVPTDVMIHINSVTDAHRDDITPALLTRVRSSSFWEITYLLPVDLLASYRFVVSADEPLARTGGQERSAWLRIHERGRPDSRATETIRNPLGVSSSVLALPDARRHPAWEGTDFRRGSTVRTRQVLTAGDERRALHLYLPHGKDAPDRLLVLFDGDVWRDLGVQDALDRWVGGPIAAVLVSSVSPERRSEDLPHPERIAHIVREEVLPVAFQEFGRAYKPSDIIVSGQSYGGLASTAIVAEYPDIATRAVAQSPSFHFRAGEQPRRPEGQRGDLSARLARTTSSGEIVMTAGSNEGGLLDQARIARATLAGTSLRVHYREFTGGHDYAWWRDGLFWGLDALYPAPRVSPPAAR